MLDLKGTGGWITAVGIAGVLVGSTAGTARAAESGGLTVTSWGGALQDAQRKSFFAPFQSATGIAIKEDQWSGELAKIKAAQQTGGNTWDVVDVDPQTASQGCSQGLFARLDYSRIIDKSRLVSGAAEPCAVASSSYATILAYDPTKLSSAPQSVTDVFDIKRFPGRRALHKSPVDTLEAALMSDGVPASDVYKVLATKEGQDRAFRKLDTIKSQVVWWEAGAQPAQMLASGQVAMALAWNGRIADANANGKNFKIAWGDQIQGFDMWVIPVGSRNTDRAYQFIKYTLEPKVNASLAQYISYGPTVSEAVNFVPKQELANLPTAPQNSSKVLVQDADFWGDFGPDLNARFSAWLAK